MNAATNRLARALRQLGRNVSGRERFVKAKVTAAISSSHADRTLLTKVGRRTV